MSVPAAAAETTDLTDLVPGPGSLTQRYALDWRVMFTGRAMLLMQVAHPAVGAAVAEHSVFLTDGWGRLLRSLASFTKTNGYQGAEASVCEAARLRDVHRDIKGVDSQGRRYHALNPEAYFWVHATGFQGIIDTQRWFGRPMSEGRQRQLYDESCGLARVLGIPDRVIPADLPAFRAYYDDMVRNRLEDNETVRILRKLEGKPMPPPPGWRLPTIAWKPLAKAPAAPVRLCTAGVLPPVLRDRLGIRWTAGDRRRFQALTATVRAMDPLVPARVRYSAMTNPLAQRAH